MKYSLLFVFTVLTSTVTLASQEKTVSIAGAWECQMRFDFPQAKGFIQETHADFMIQKNQTDYVRTGKIRISFKEFPSLFMEAHTHETGTLKLANNQLAISPKTADVKVINSGALDKKLVESQLLAPLSRKEVWQVTQLTNNALEMYVKGEPVKDSCKRKL